MRVHLSNLGCKLNQAEIESLARQFTARGHRVVSSIEAADVHVINSCTVTHVADRSSRKLARKASRIDATIKTVITGCYATAAADEAAQLHGVNLVVDNTDKAQLVDAVVNAFPELANSEPESAFPYGESATASSRSRVAVKIEDGCNMNCSFCIIPMTRGSQVSRPAEDIKREVAQLVSAGYQEVILTGVQISSYRWQEMRLFDLVVAVLPVMQSARLRLTSIAPWNFDPRLLDLLRDGSVCPHVHLSLQSGYDRTLDRMKRPYSMDDFEVLVDAIRQAQPETAITTDVIVGFPGETSADFDRSLDNVTQLGFAKIHAFPYSIRPGTTAALLENQVQPQVMRARMQQMLEVAEHAEQDFYQQQQGRQLQVLWESLNADTMHGTSCNYVKVRGQLDHQRLGTLRNEHIRPGEDGQLWAA